MDVYRDNGFRNRDHYLRYLAETTGCDLDMVRALADLLGPDEDFDGLVTALEDLGNG